MPGGSLGRQVAISVGLIASWRPTGAKLVGLLRSLLTSYIAIGVTLYIVPGRQSSGPMAVALLVLLVLVTGLVLRPVLLGLTVLLGPLGLLLVGMLAQGVILSVALSVAPDVAISTFPRTIAVSWIAAVVAAVVNWLLDAGSQDAYLAQLLGRAVRVSHRQAGLDPALRGAPGLLVVQWDGVGAGLLRQAIVAGAVPTLARWLRTGSHQARRWHTGLPATTPAGQAVLLHGDTTTVPSFRWYDRVAGREFVANRPGDAAEIEERLSNGRGLLADGGVSVSNLFSGDAPQRILTMSDARLPPRTTRGLASFATARGGLVRALVVFGGQVVVETYQARRQRRRDVRPRVKRGGLFALLRAVTTALLRDLNVAIVAEQMSRGAPVIFVDFVDYDELAHHAGPSRPESIRTLDGLDRVLQFFGDVADEVARDYEIVVLSDHGQSQGEPFAQRTGESIHDLVRRLVHDESASRSPGAAARSGPDEAPDREDEPAERWGPANVLLTSAARTRGLAARTVLRSRARTAPGSEVLPAVTLGTRPTAAKDTAAKDTEAKDTEAKDTEATGTEDRHADRSGDVVVEVSGSLAHLYLPSENGSALDAETIAARWPRLTGGLVASTGICAVLDLSSLLDAPVAAIADGWLPLRCEPGSNGDAAADLGLRYGPSAVEDISQLMTRENVGDLVLLGSHDLASGEVNAFEELVGSHGGLGGDQTEAVFIAPTAWAPPSAITASGSAPALTGLQVHQALLSRLRKAGLRPGDSRTVDDSTVGEGATVSAAAADGEIAGASLSGRVDG